MPSGLSILAELRKMTSKDFQSNDLKKTKTKNVKIEIKEHVVASSISIASPITKTRKKYAKCFASVAEEDRG